MASHMLHRASHAKGKVRNSSIELLRVIAMLLIVTQHSVVHSICNPSTAPLSVPMLFATMLGADTTGSIGVLLFFGISAWFLCNDGNPSVRSALKRIWLVEREMLFYAWGILLLRIILGHTPPNASLVVYSLFPGITGLWWYMTAYIIFLAFYPFLTVGLRRMGSSLHGGLCMIIMAIWGIYSIVPVDVLQFRARNFMLFIFLYVLISYYRWYMKLFSIRTSAIAFFAGVALFTLPILLLQVFGWVSHINALRLHSAAFAGAAKLPAILIAFGMMNIGVQKHFQSVVVNKVASTTLGIYLIHEDPFVKSILWVHHSNAESFINDPWRDGLMVIGCILAVYVVCFGIDWLRQALFSFTVDRHKGAWFDKLWNKISASQNMRRFSALVDDKMIQ